MDLATLAIALWLATVAGIGGLVLGYRLGAKEEAQKHRRQ